MIIILVNILASYNRQEQSTACRHSALSCSVNLEAVPGYIRNTFLVFLHKCYRNLVEIYSYSIVLNKTYITLKHLAGNNFPARERLEES